jgi:hypothetical protein
MQVSPLTLLKSVNKAYLRVDLWLTREEIRIVEGGENKQDGK